MQRTNIIQLKPSKTQIKMLKEMMLLSSCVYNSTNYVIRQQFFRQEKIYSFFNLQQKIQNKEDYQLLGRSYALPRIQVYSETNSARFKLIKSKTQKRVGLPKYLKNRKTNTTLPSYLVIDGCQYSIKKNHIEIPLSRQMRKNYKVGKCFKIKYNGVLKHKGKQQRGQVRIKNKQFYFHQTVEFTDVIKKETKIRVGLDLGIKKLFSIYINNGQDNIIGSKRFFKQWEHHTKLISEEQQKLSLINKKTSNKLSKLYSTRNKYQNNLFNNLIAKLFKILKRNNVYELFVGDVKNIRSSCSKGKKVNQMINNYWSFDKLYKKLENKSEENGITMSKVTEEYSSRTCPICYDDNKNNCKDRIFTCSQCGFVEHRDVVGARNILTKGMYGSYQSIHRDEIVPLEVSV